MKRFLVFIMLIAVLILPLQGATVSVSKAQNRTDYTADIKEVLADFIAANPERTSFGIGDTTGESEAAEDIANRLASYGYASNQIVIQRFGAEFTDEAGSIFSSGTTQTRYSQNVLLRLSAPDSKGRIVIGCNYDNVYIDKKSYGAMDNGSGVAVCLMLAKHLKTASLIYDIDIVFFGAGYHSFAGSEEYVRMYGVKDTVMMFNVNRIGGDNTYIYTGESKNALEEALLGRGSFDSIPNSLPLINAEFIKGYPYTHYAMLGNHAHFMSRGLTVANIYGAYYGGISLDDKEGKADILLTDTVEKMEEAYPDCYIKMSDVVNLLFNAVLDAELIELAKGIDRSVFLMQWIAYLILAFVVVASMFAYYYIGKRLIKKYPKSRVNTKTSIFGAEYDNKG